MCVRFRSARRHCKCRRDSEQSLATSGDAVPAGGPAPWNLDCHTCGKFVLSGADLLYWRRKREQWASIAERAPDDATADYLHQVFAPTAQGLPYLPLRTQAARDLSHRRHHPRRRPATARRGRTRDAQAEAQGPGGSGAERRAGTEGGARRDPRPARPYRRDARPAPRHPARPRHRRRPAAYRRECHPQAAASRPFRQQPHPGRTPGQAARSNNRFLDKRIAGLEAQLLNVHIST